MDNIKRIEILRKKNQELQEQLDWVLKELDINNDETFREKELTGKLIEELESIKNEWTFEVNELKKYKDEYIALINELKEMKKIMLDGNITTPWYKKLFHKKE